MEERIPTRFNFPKPWMKRGELEKLGISRVLLDRAYHAKNQTFATKVDPLKSNSAVIYYTPGLDEWMVKDIETQVRSMRSR